MYSCGISIMTRFHFCSDFQPNLWSNIFKHHLELGQNDLAYNALITNPDPVRSVPCVPC